MFNPIWARCLTSAALLATAAPALAAATVVNFESAPPLTVVGPTQPDLAYTESGVTLTPTGSDAIVDPSFCDPSAGDSCISNNSSIYLTSLNGATVTITAPRAFSINAFDAAFFPMPTPAEFFAGSMMGLNIVGTLWDGGLFETTLTLLEDSTTPGDFVFSTYSLGTPMLSSLTLGACAFIGTDCVRGGIGFTNAGYQFNDLQFAIDNLSLTIPEPSALWLMALSLGGLALTRRSTR